MKSMDLLETLYRLVVAYAEIIFMEDCPKKNVFSLNLSSGPKDHTNDQINVVTYLTVIDKSIF